MALTDEELLDILDNYEDLLETQIDKNNTVEPDKLIDITAIDYLAKIRTIKDSTLNAPGDILQLLSDRIPALSNGKIPVEVGSLNVTVGNASLEIANDAGNPIPISDAGGSITVDGSVSISNFPATQVVNTGLTQPLTDAQLRSAPVSVTGTFWQATQPISAANLPLPTNAATSALQTTGNTSLTNIDTKTPALGQALAAASTPVVLPAAQITALTPPTSVGLTGTLPAFATTPTFNLGTAPNLTFTNTSFTANAGTNLNTSALALESGGNLAGINSKLPSNLTVTATRLLVDGSGVTQPVSLTGVSTAANQTTGNASLAEINTKLPASLGAKTAANSLSVTQAFAPTSTLTNVASSATSVTLLAANNNRKTAIIINDSSSDLYVVLNASTASTTNYSLFLAAKVGNTPSFLAINGDDYSGEIRGIWSSANGFARITEVV